MSILKVYFNNPTAGGTDGTEASEDGAQTSPIKAVILAETSTAVSVAKKCALRCDSGYQTSGPVQLSFQDSQGQPYTSANYKLAADNGFTEENVYDYATWLDSLTINDTIGATNYIFWILMSAAAGETPKSDVSISLAKVDKVVETN